MNRAEMLDRLRATEDAWDVAIIGGGATGLGVAVDAASRGFRTALFEQHDFAKATSSRSTKLVHGGVRYLQQGNVSLVLEALRERGTLRLNAPHLVHDLQFIVPNYDWWEAPFYGIGLRVYDMLAGKYGFGRSRNLSKEDTLRHLPTLETNRLRGGVVYHDGQFDDSRLAVHLAMTAAEHGAVLLNYAKVTNLRKQHGMISGLIVLDSETGAEIEVKAKVVVNATGVFSDGVRLMDEADSERMVAPSQGVHIVLDKSFMPGDSAIMVPHTDDGRVLFAIPWHDRVVVGTTDTPVDSPALEPRAFAEELDFLLTHAARYLAHDPGPENVLSVFAGQRPLVRGGSGTSTAALSRDHVISISRSGLVTVVGGKWTTYRRMAEDTVDQAILVGELAEEPCRTKDLHIHGYHESADDFGALSVYGSDAEEIERLSEKDVSLLSHLHELFPYTAAEVIWAVRHEMARTLEDILARRTRALFLDARAAIECAPVAAKLLAKELGRDAAWEQEQVRAFTELARGYLIAS